MKTILAATALALFGLVPAIGTACDYMDGTSASVNPIEQMAAASTPAASKVPAATIAKTPAPNAVKQVAVKVKPASDQKLAAGTTN